MPDPRHRRHVLQPFLARAGANPETGSGIVMEVSPYRGYLNLRGDPGDDGFLECVHEALGQRLPLAANTFTEGGCRVFWLGPDEWLVMTEPLAGEAVLATRLADALAHRAYALTDLTGGQICIRLSGRNARDALAKGCTLDLHPRAFHPGHCAQTVLGKASMLICRSGAMPDSAASGDGQARGEPGSAFDGEVFDIIVRRTFAEYAAEWLYRSAEEFGVRVECNG